MQEVSGRILVGDDSDSQGGGGTGGGRAGFGVSRKGGAGRIC